MGLQRRRARAKFRERQQADAPSAHHAGATAPQMNVFTFGVSQFGGTDGLAGPGTFIFGTSRFGGEDNLASHETPAFIFDHTQFGRGALS